MFQSTEFWLIIILVSALLFAFANYRFSQIQKRDNDAAVEKTISKINSGVESANLNFDSVNSKIALFNSQVDSSLLNLKKDFDEIRTLTDGYKSSIEQSVEISKQTLESILFPVTPLDIDIMFQFNLNDCSYCKGLVYDIERETSFYNLRQAHLALFRYMRTPPLLDVDNKLLSIAHAPYYNDSRNLDEAVHINCTYFSGINRCIEEMLRGVEMFFTLDNETYIPYIKFKFDLSTLEEYKKTDKLKIHYLNPQHQYVRMHLLITDVNFGYIHKKIPSLREFLQGSVLVKISDTINPDSIIIQGGSLTFGKDAKIKIGLNFNKDDDGNYVVFDNGFYKYYVCNLYKKNIDFSNLY